MTQTHPHDGQRWRWRAWPRAPWPRRPLREHPQRPGHFLKDVAPIFQAKCQIVP